MTKTRPWGIAGMIICRPALKGRRHAAPAGAVLDFPARNIIAAEAERTEERSEQGS